MQDNWLAFIQLYSQISIEHIIFIREIMLQRFRLLNIIKNNLKGSILNLYVFQFVFLKIDAF